VTALTVAATDIPADAILFWSFTASNGAGGEGHYVHGTYKALDLQPAGLDFSVSPVGDGAFDVTVRASGLALYVMLESQTAGRYSDNAFDLAAGETRRITFTPTVPVSGAPAFRIYDLYSCQSAG
jgi:beta-mannosidase